MSFRKITEREFMEKQSIPVLFYDSLHSRCFGVIESKASKFKFGWQSDLVEPEIGEISENIYTIGIDQNFVIIDLVKNSILLNLNLFYNFYMTRFCENFLFICTELEVLVVNRFTYEVAHSIALPDFFEDLIFENQKIKIICAGQTVIEDNM